MEGLHGQGARAPSGALVASAVVGARAPQTSCTLPRSYAENPIVTVEPVKPTSKRTLFLSFWAEVHYNSLHPSTVSREAAGMRRRRSGACALPVQGAVVLRCGPNAA